MIPAGNLKKIRSPADKILGRPLATSERAKENLSIWTGVPVLGLAGLASTGYGPEAALTILAPLGLARAGMSPQVATSHFRFVLAKLSRFQEMAASCG